MWKKQKGLAQEHREDRVEDQEFNKENRTEDQEAYATDRVGDAVDREAIRVKRRRVNLAQIFAYLLIVAIGSYGFYQQDQDNRLRCIASAEQRQVQRDLVNGIYDLAIGAIQPVPGTENTPLTPLEVAERDQYIQNAKTFKENTLKKITPNKACVKYDLAK